MLYKGNVQTSNVKNQTPVSRSLTQWHTDAHYCHLLFREIAQQNYNTFQSFLFLEFLLFLNKARNRTRFSSFTEGGINKKFSYR